MFVHKLSWIQGTKYALAIATVLALLVRKRLVLIKGAANPAYAATETLFVCS
jgi:hypothetical protein